MGPTQPGVTTPDPTRLAAASVGVRLAASRAATPKAGHASAPTQARDERRPRLPPGPVRGGTRQLSASPVLIGSVTILIAIVAVFISYQANNGLPFVPTYQLKAEMPNGAKLVKGNEVRAGGFRVGIVKNITTERKTVDGKERAIAVLDLKLDKKIQPLSVDSTLSVRPRSALGLKYVELIPGRSKKTFQDGDTIPLSRATPNAPELEDVLSTFPPRTRDDARKSLEGFGDSIAGRGEAINTTIRELEPFTRYLLPVMRNLSSQKTELKGFFPGLGAAAARGGAGGGGAGGVFWRTWPTTFAAISRDPEALRETISESPPTLQAATESFRVQTPFLARFAAVSRDLQPGTALLPTTLPLVNAALEAGVPAFRETPGARRATSRTCSGPPRTWATTRTRCSR